MSNRQAYRMTRLAVADLDHALAWSAAEYGEIQGLHYSRILDRRIDTIVAYPEVGRRRSDLFPGLRSFPAGKHILLYVVRERVLIMRIAHQRQQLDELLYEE